MGVCISLKVTIKCLISTSPYAKKKFFLGAPTINIHQGLKLEGCSLVSTCERVFCFRQKPFLCVRASCMCVCVHSESSHWNELFTEESLLLMYGPPAAGVPLPSSQETTLIYCSPCVSLRALSLRCRCCRPHLALPLHIKWIKGRRSEGGRRNKPMTYTACFKTLILEPTELT